MINTLRNAGTSLLLILALCTGVIAQQEYSEEKQIELEFQWQHADPESDGIVGVSSYKAYSDLLKNRKPVPVIVAIIDSGTETFHPDLNDAIWVNADEIPGNGVDDDQNGYVDDIHGWSFISGPGGDVEFDNLEFTRVYNGLRQRFEGKEAASVAAADKADYDRYLKMKADYQSRLDKANEEKEQYDGLMQALDISKSTFRKILGNNYTLEDVEKVKAEDDFMKAAKELVMFSLQEGFDAEIEAWRNSIYNQLEYAYNLEYDPRYMVGDNYEDATERFYGTNRVDGPHAGHGTHVAGLVGAEHNGSGVDGICSSAQLMIIRCVPDGDERDKDVANAIRYAVDNGARIINMSFGKSLSPQKEAVDEAVRYAESKGVLIIHAAGNESKNLDVRDNFPNREYKSGGECSTWMEVGASSQDASSLAAPFSNYGQTAVDLFAPGYDVFSTYPDYSLKSESGTSMAAPVAAGVAATVMAYFPQLSALEVKEILMASVTPYKKTKVLLPGSEKKKVKFGKLCVSGGVINLYRALELAAQRTGQ